MRIRIEPSRRSVVDWGDGCSFGGTGEFQGSDWDARPGHEWLVTDPFEDKDFTKVIDASVAASPTETVAQEYRDPFFYLPMEFIHGIFEFLNHNSMISFISEDDNNNCLEAEQHWLGLKNRRRIWACCERIVDDVEKRFAGAREACGFVSEEIEAVSAFRISTLIEPKENEERCASDVYFCPTPTDAPSLQAITVYFLPDGTVIGIEFSLDGEQRGRILGHQSIPFQSVTVPSSVVINGFLLSLGPELPAVRDRPIKRIGVLTEDSPLQPRFRFGT
ncbi:uncharacterized protein KD926_009324 [Aspergillus affinis]|uniref:uncharacterized protein n=1 Tax=Aspergillus affinis TaxID=1070780 RepID=UPI0022FE2F9E|nr:uncharacterized protein KD926_009324 [Aspergillus affinis]KAI9039599.1 hypothetical protein KD926_009324 [Aspergillus affinis]